MKPNTTRQFYGRKQYTRKKRLSSYTPCSSLARDTELLTWTYNKGTGRHLHSHIQLLYVNWMDPVSQCMNNWGLYSKCSLHNVDHKQHCHIHNAIEWFSASPTNGLGYQFSGKIGVSSPAQGSSLKPATIQTRLDEGLSRLYYQSRFC